MARWHIPAGMLAATSSILLLGLTLASMLLAPAAEIPADISPASSTPVDGADNQSVIFQSFVGMELTGKLLFHGSPEPLASFDLYISENGFVDADNITSGQPPPFFHHHLAPAEHDMDWDTGRPVLVLDGSELTRHPFTNQSGAFSYSGAPVPTNQSCESGILSNQSDPYTVCRSVDPSNASAPFVIHKYNASAVKPVPTRLGTGYVFIWMPPVGTPPAELESARDGAAHLHQRSDLYFTALGKSSVSAQKVLLAFQWAAVAGLVVAGVAWAAQRRAEKPAGKITLGGPTATLLLLMERSTRYLLQLRRNYVFWAAAMVLLILGVLASWLLAPDFWNGLSRLAPMTAWVVMNVIFLVVAALALAGWQMWQAQRIQAELTRVRRLVEQEQAL